MNLIGAACKPIKFPLKLLNTTKVAQMEFFMINLKNVNKQKIQAALRLMQLFEAYSSITYTLDFDLNEIRESAQLQPSQFKKLLNELRNANVIKYRRKKRMNESDVVLLNPAVFVFGDSFDNATRLFIEGGYANFISD